MSNITLLLSSMLGSRGGSTPTYTISGTVSGDVAEGVTITLTGDASDSTTTAGDGTYSFTVLDGSYTVTPTYPNLAFTPTSDSVTVSGGDETSNFATEGLLLPYLFSMSSLAQSSGGIIAQNDDWYARTDGLSDPQITTSVADSNSYTPTGITKGLTVAWGATRDFAAQLLPYAISASRESIRIAILTKSTNEDRATTIGVDSVLPLNATTAFVSFWPVRGGDNATTYAKYDDSTTISEFNNYDSTDMDARRYHWYRAEWNFVDNKVRVSVVRSEDSSLIWSYEANMNAAGVTLNHIPTGLRYLYVTNQEGTSSCTVTKLWIGTAADDWPT